MVLKIIVVLFVVYSNLWALDFVDPFLANNKTVKENVLKHYPTANVFNLRQVIKGFPDLSALNLTSLRYNVRHVLFREFSDEGKFVYVYITAEGIHKSSRDYKQHEISLIAKINLEEIEKSSLIGIHTRTWNNDDYVIRGSNIHDLFFEEDKQKLSLLYAKDSRFWPIEKMRTLAEKKSLRKNLLTKVSNMYEYKTNNSWYEKENYDTYRSGGTGGYIYGLGEKRKGLFLADKNAVYLSSGKSSPFLKSLKMFPELASDCKPYCKEFSVENDHLVLDENTYLRLNKYRSRRGYVRSDLLTEFGKNLHNYAMVVDLLSESYRPLIDSDLNIYSYHDIHLNTPFGSKWHHMEYISDFVPDKYGQFIEKISNKIKKMNSEKKLKRAFFLKKIFEIYISELQSDIILNKALPKIKKDNAEMARNLNLQDNLNSADSKLIFEVLVMALDSMDFKSEALYNVKKKLLEMYSLDSYDDKFLEHVRALLAKNGNLWQKLTLDESQKPFGLVISVLINLINE